MIRYPICIVCCTLLSGCIQKQLTQDTRKISAELFDLQRQQVLDNLAMFRRDKDAIPSILRLKSGTVQVTDQFQPTLHLSWVNLGRPTDTLDLQGSRQLTQNWTVVPVTDPTDLRRLQLLFQRVVGGLSAETFADRWDELNRQKNTTRVTAASQPVDAGLQPTTKPTISVTTTDTENPIASGKEMLARFSSLRDVSWLETDLPSDGWSYEGSYMTKKVWVAKSKSEQLSNFIFATLGSTPAAKAAAQQTFIFQEGPVLTPR